MWCNAPSLSVGTRSLSAEKRGVSTGPQASSERAQLHSQQNDMPAVAHLTPGLPQRSVGRGPVSSASNATSSAAAPELGTVFVAEQVSGRRCSGSCCSPNSCISRAGDPSRTWRWHHLVRGRRLLPRSVAASTSAGVFAASCPSGRGRLASGQRDRVSLAQCAITERPPGAELTAASTNQGPCHRPKRQAFRLLLRAATSGSSRASQVEPSARKPGKVCPGRDAVQ
jgi:hypothetical protein